MRSQSFLRPVAIAVLLVFALAATGEAQTRTSVSISFYNVPIDNAPGTWGQSSFQSSVRMQGTGIRTTNGKFRDFLKYTGSTSSRIYSADGTDLRGGPLSGNDNLNPRLYKFAYRPGKNASAQNATAVAAPSTYRFGTLFYIEGLGWFVVTDRGGAIQGNRIDIFIGPAPVRDGYNWRLGSGTKRAIFYPPGTNRSSLPGNPFTGSPAPNPAPNPSPGPAQKKPGAPTIVSPKEGAKSARSAGLQVSWKAVSAHPNVDAYYVAVRSGGKWLYRSRTRATSVKIPASKLGGGAHEIHVFAHNAKGWGPSTKRKVQLTVPRPTKPTAVSPKGWAKVQGPVTFRWTMPNNQRADRYAVAVYKRTLTVKGTTWKRVERKVTEGTSTQIQLPKGTYAWRVIAWRRGGGVGPWSGGQGFVVK